MRVAFLGDFALPWSVEGHAARALESLGHEVVRIEEWRETADGVLAAARAARPDLFLWTRNRDVAGDAGAMLAGMPCPTAAFCYDLYAGMARAADVGRSAWWRCGTFFSPDGGTPDAWWRERGVNHAWLPAGVDESACVLGMPDEDLACDVAFLGARAYHPEWPHRRQLIHFLRTTYGKRFRLWPEDLDVDRLWGDRLNSALASARVVVGDSVYPPGHPGRYWSDRVPEVVGRGGVLAMPETPGLREAYPAVATWPIGDWTALRTVVDSLLTEPTEAAARRRREGVAGCAARHTYRHRMAEMLAHLGTEAGLVGAAG